MRAFSVFALCLCVSCPTAIAGETAWQEVAPGVSVRLISAGAIQSPGKGLFALEIDMPDNTKTYWRVPGETGLPTELDFTASTGIAGHEQHWPHPLIDQSGGYLDYVYYGHTVLPFSVEVTGPGGSLDLQATLGVCSDICIPAQARLVLPLTQSGDDAANALRIDQAMAEVPIAWDRGAEPAGVVKLVNDGSAIGVEIDPDVVVPESLIVANAAGEPLFGAPQKSPQDNLVLLPIMGKTNNSGVEGLQVELSFMTAMGAYEISRTIEAGIDADVEGPAQ